MMTVQGLGSILVSIKELVLGVLYSTRAGFLRVAALVGFSPLALLLALLLSPPLLGLGLSAQRMFTVRA